MKGRRQRRWWQGRRLARQSSPLDGTSDPDSCSVHGVRSHPSLSCLCVIETFPGRAWPSDPSCSTLAYGQSCSGTALSKPKGEVSACTLIKSALCQCRAACTHTLSPAGWLHEAGTLFALPLRSSRQALCVIPSSYPVMHLFPLSQPASQSASARRPGLRYAAHNIMMLHPPPRLRRESEARRGAANGSPKEPQRRPKGLCSKGGRQRRVCVVV